MKVFKIFGKSIGVVTILLNIFLLLLIISTVVSLTYLNFTASETETKIYMQDNYLHFVTEVDVTNKGYYDFTNVTISITLVDVNSGLQMTRSQHFDAVPIGNTKLPIHVTFPAEPFLLNDTTYYLILGISGSYVYELMVFAVNYTTEGFSWDAPLDGLDIIFSTNQISSSQSEIIANYSFTAFEYGDLPLNVSLTAFSGNTVTAMENTTIIASAGTLFTGDIKVTVPRGDTYTVVLSLWNVIFSYNYSSVVVVS